MRALYTAATGMLAQEKNVEVIANNVANMRTNGFKRQTIHFQDLLYEQHRRAGSPTSDQNTQVPAGLFVGSGVKVVATPRIMSQGNVSQTERTYDVAMRGEGHERGPEVVAVRPPPGDVQGEVELGAGGDGAEHRRRAGRQRGCGIS